MSILGIILLIVILGVLIFVHEFGHFIIAKKSGIRVDEFAIGFPPRIWSITKNGTKYSLGCIPFGGFVKIFGETVDEEALDPKSGDSFLHKSKLTQSAVLVGGVMFNIIFAFILISITFIVGSPAVVTDGNIQNIKESFVVVTGVYDNSPAYRAGIEPGDEILRVVKGDKILEVSDITVSKIQDIISNRDDKEVSMLLRRGGEERTVTLTTESGIISSRPAIGISMERIGKLKLPFWEAIGKSYITTGEMIRDIFLGLIGLIASAFSGHGSLDNVAGPIGIVGLVDNAANFGFFYILSFTAFISINLAVLNILPLPALDGGRLLVILIETIIRRPIKATVVNAINNIGFALLILFMIVVTINDVFRLF